MSSPDSRAPIRVLFVDDEKFVLDAIKRTVRKGFDATFAEGGQEALEILHSDVETFSIVCTDMRMPIIDGVAVLKEFRANSPETTRILLTGQADLDAAIAAVNEGSVFRFLTKPTNPDQLMSALMDADELFRLHNAERELLEQTLRGSVQALLETLSLANPVAFARAQRIRNYVERLLPQLQIDNQWEVEIAVMLSQIGAVTLPTKVTERLNHGAVLDEDETEMVQRMPAVADRLLAGIPRLENVRAIILGQKNWKHPEAPVASKILQLASELDTLHERDLAPDVLVARIGESAESYGPEVFAAFEAMMSGDGSARRVRLIHVAQLEIGMRLASDVKTKDGLLLVGRGQEVTQSLLDRIENFQRSSGLEDESVGIYEDA